MKCGAVKKLVELLTSDEKNIQTPAVHSVGNLLAGNDEETQLLISYGVLPKFATLLNCPNKGMRKEAAWAISNITAGSREQIQAVIVFNLFPTLIEIISNESAVDLKKEAIWACGNALERGSLAQVQYLIDLGAIIVFCDTLSSHDLQTVLLVLERLAVILECATVNDSLDKIMPSIERCGGLNKVKSLKEHSDDEVVSAALKVLEFIK